MGDKKASKRRPKKRSAAQKAVSSSLNKGNKENLAGPIPSSSGASKPGRKPKDYKKEYQNLQRKLRHSETYKKKLKAALDMYKTRAEVSEKAAEAARQEIIPPTMRCMERGFVSSLLATSEITMADFSRVKKKKCFQPSPKTNSKCEACTAAKIRCRFRDRKRYFAERRRGLPGSSAASDVSSPLRSSDAAVSQEAPSLPTAFPPTYSSYITRYYGCFVNPSHDLDAYKPVQSLTGPSPAHTLDINLLRFFRKQANVNFKELRNFKSTA
ncbi:hypothetical protein R3P38DRAFT_2806306 [Favolaschia claudopus]|uniref:Uncharacterized protein n=1 Tax=Favolaschia claudopus TaxID=2862362 RepID=A0AAV9ZKC5_9AGAR